MWHHFPTVAARWQEQLSLIGRHGPLCALACFAMQVALYSEYVESDSDWADKVNRDGPNGSWAHMHSFTLGVCTFVPRLHGLPCAALARVFSSFRRPFRT